MKKSIKYLVIITSILLFIMVLVYLNGLYSSSKFEIISQKYDQINDFHMVNGKIYLYVNDNGVNYFIADGNKYDVRKSFSGLVSDGENFAFVENSTHVFYNGKRQKDYVRIYSLKLFDGKPLYSVVTSSNELIGVYGDDELFRVKIFKNNVGNDDGWNLIETYSFDNQFAFKVSLDVSTIPGKAYYWFDGAQGEIFDRVTPPVLINGTISYLAMLDGEIYLVLDTKKTLISFDDFQKLKLEYPEFEFSNELNISGLKSLKPLEGTKEKTYFAFKKLSTGGYRNLVVIGDYIGPDFDQIRLVDVTPDGDIYYIGIENDENTRYGFFDDVQYRKSLRTLFRNKEKLLESSSKIGGSQIAKYNKDLFIYETKIYTNGKEVKREIDCLIRKEAGNSFESVYSIDGKLVFVERKSCKEYIKKEK